jgi:hypothetical protein
MFLAPGAMYPGLASEFAYPAAFGDLLTAVLALVALWAVVKLEERTCSGLGLRIGRNY